jgi:UDP-N-acetylglucosamine 2-epimerase
LNPNVGNPVHRLLGGVQGVWLVQPLDYMTLVWVLARSYFVLTDSGGLQEEAPSLGKPVLVLRHATERPEAVHAGTARLVGPTRRRIVAEASRLLEDAAAYAAMAHVANPFGDGHAAARIVQALLRFDRRTPLDCTNQAALSEASVGTSEGHFATHSARRPNHRLPVPRVDPGGDARRRQLGARQRIIE